MKKFFKLLKFPPSQKVLFVKALILVIAIRAALWIVPFKWLKKHLMHDLKVKKRAAEADRIHVHHVIYHVKNAAGLVPCASCLTQSLAALILMRHNGQDSELKIGVAKDENEQFRAHAWLEANGQIILGKLPKHSQFKVLESISG